MTATSTNRRGGLVVQAFPSEADAEAAVRTLLDAGFPPGEISVVARERGRAESAAADTGADVGTGAGIGAATGGALGTLGGLLLGATALTIPGLGLVVAGPLAAVLAGAGTGAVAGGLAGALAGWGVSEQEARHYQERLEAGDLIVAVEAGAREADARRLLGAPGGA